MGPIRKRGPQELNDTPVCVCAHLRHGNHRADAGLVGLFRAREETADG